MTAGPNLCFMFDRAPELAAIGDGDEPALVAVLSWHLGDERDGLGRRLWVVLFGGCAVHI